MTKLLKNKEILKTISKIKSKVSTPKKVINLPKSTKSKPILSSILSSFIGIFSFILFKIPLVSKLTRKIIRWYVKTKWWKVIFDILVKLRKGFIIFNALIAIYALVDITGFSTDNIIGGFYGLGVKYVEMITSLFSKIFNWLVDFFDYKVVPNIPSKEFIPSPEYYNYNYTFKELEPTTDWNTWFRYSCYTIIGI